MERKTTVLKPVNKHTRVNVAADINGSNFGLYAYVRAFDNAVVYIGLDKNIQKDARHTRHMAPSAKSDQVINSVLQKAKPGTYKYEVIALCKDLDWLADTEAALIAAFRAVGMCEYNIQSELGTDIQTNVEDNIEERIGKQNEK